VSPLMWSCLAAGAKTRGRGGGKSVRGSGQSRRNSWGSGKWRPCSWPSILPYSWIISVSSEREPRTEKPVVENQQIQRAAQQVNELLAADWQQIQPVTLGGSAIPNPWLWLSRLGSGVCSGSTRRLQTGSGRRRLSRQSLPLGEWWFMAARQLAARSPCRGAICVMLLLSTGGLAEHRSKAGERRGGDDAGISTAV
jgi:hypothetical protein